MSVEVNEIHKTLFVNSNENNDFEDIQDEPQQIETTNISGNNDNNNEIINDINPILASDEGLSLIQASKDYSDAIQSIATNSWDTNSWNIYIEEVELGRGGATSLEEAYIKFLEKFPLSAKIQKKLIDYYIREKFNNNIVSGAGAAVTQGGDSSTTTTTSTNTIDFKYIENLYNKCLSPCRNVTLYLDYLAFMKYHLLDKIYQNGNNKKDDMTYSIARSNYEALVEKVLEQIGMAMDSNCIWKLYIEFINTYPELGIADSAGRKLSNMRKIYQRAICIPMNDLDSFWREYETLEKSVGEHLADRVLPEFKEKYLHAKAIFKERQRITSSLVFDKLAIPPTQPPIISSNSTTSGTGGSTLSSTTNTSTGSGSVSNNTLTSSMTSINYNLFQFETQQIEIWIQWLKYELSNPDNLPLEGLKAMLNYIYRKCLCCLRYHPEIWLSYAHFQYNIEYAIYQNQAKKSETGYSTLINENGNNSNTSSKLTNIDITLESKNILAQAIQILPHIAILRIALAEYDEKAYYFILTHNTNSTTTTSMAEKSIDNISSGKLLVAKNILKETYEELPSSLTFSVYQKFIRRHEGECSAVIRHLIIGNIFYFILFYLIL